MAHLSERDVPDIETILENMGAVPREEVWSPGDLLRIEKTILTTEQGMPAQEGQDGTPMQFIGYVVYLGMDNGKFLVASVSDIPKVTALSNLGDFKRVAKKFKASKFGTEYDKIDALFEEELKKTYANQTFLEEAVGLGIEPAYRLGPRESGGLSLEFKQKIRESDDVKLRYVAYVIHCGKIELWVNLLEYGMNYVQEERPKQFADLKTAVNFFESIRENPAFLATLHRGGGGGKR